jgi:oligopeptide/dipeptide ABC transporter ATP-binding protein
VPLLEVRDLRTHFDTPGGVVRAVDGVSFSLGRGEALGIVGESGSGKSVTALTMLRLFGPLTRAHVSGRVQFEGRDLLKLSESELLGVRGAQIGMIFQDPLTSLNPVLPVGEQIAETLRYHEAMSRGAARRRSVELLELVGIPDPRRRHDDLPYRFSGGMRQRIMIAIAIACEPKLLIADEPTTALDVTVQAQILLLLDRLRRELGMALIMISHDFGVVAATCDHVQVMYAGRLVERGPVAEILERAHHPYTAGLMRLVPRLDLSRHHRLHPIPGQPPTVRGAFRGCRFAPRCEYVTERGRQEEPPLFEVSPGHLSACWLAIEPGSRPWDGETGAVSAGMSAIVKTDDVEHRS